MARTTDTAGNKARRSSSARTKRPAPAVEERPVLQPDPDTGLVDGSRIDITVAVDEPDPEPREERLERIAAKVADWSEEELERGAGMGGDYAEVIERVRAERSKAKAR